MKKTIIWSLALMMGLSLAFSGPIFAEDNTQSSNGDVKPEPTLYQEKTTSTEKINNNDIKTRQLMSSFEKILTPDQIKYFENIVRQGNALYGVRKMTPPANTTATNTEVKKEAKKLEKIAAPQLLHLYEQIKKVGTALWGIKKEEPKKVEPKKEDAAKLAYVKPEMAACAIAAIESKDDSLKAANTYQVTKVNEAITARTTCQKAVINSSISTTTPSVIGAQREALTACVKTFQTSLQQIREASKKSHDAIWETYKVSLKACQPTTSSTTPEAVLMIEDGGGNIFGDIK